MSSSFSKDNSWFWYQKFYYFYLFNSISHWNNYLHLMIYYSRLHFIWNNLDFQIFFISKCFQLNSIHHSNDCHIFLNLYYLNFSNEFILPFLLNCINHAIVFQANSSGEINFILNWSMMFLFFQEIIWNDHISI